jgi:hypothetical protein
MEVTQILVNRKTGEIVQEAEGVFYPADQLEKTEEARKMREEFREQGSFVWFLYTKVEELNLNISTANLTRLMFLSTYMDYSNKLVEQKQEYCGFETAIDKKRMFEILGLTPSTFYRFFNEMIDKEILLDVDGDFYLDENYFYRGELGKTQFNNAMRLYRAGIRQMYANVAQEDHKWLGHCFRILPYISIDFNILCWNPDESDPDKIVPMRLIDMLATIGYNETNITRFKNSFFPVARDKANFILGHETGPLFINPNIYYGGVRRSQATSYLKRFIPEFNQSYR